MELQKELDRYQKQTKVCAREEKIRETIQKSKETFLLKEQEYAIGYVEFIFSQFRLIRKRWWLFQTFLLGLASIILSNTESGRYRLRILGIIGVLFVVLLIPELWKNKTHDCMQIENTCFYSLRQIYAAKMMLFGIVDTCMIICFGIIARGRMGIMAEEFWVQFLFPMLIAACICFGTLCNHKLVNEGTAIIFCLLWSAVWSIFVTNESFYQAIAFPIWCVLSGFAFLFLLGAIYRTIYRCNEFWEVNFSGITNQ